MVQKRNILKIMLRTTLMLLAIGGGLLLLSAVKTKEAKPCAAIEINFVQAKQAGFIQKKDILSLITDLVGQSPLGTPLHRFDLNVIEIELENNPWVADAQLYFDNNQVLHITIDEPFPVARLIDIKGNHFYIDAHANELPLSKTYRADLPVFTNVPIKRDTALGFIIVQHIAALAEAIVEDPFWLAQASQIYVLPNGKMELIPSVGNHIVELGNGDEPKAMLARLKIFYKTMAAAGRLETYERINASFGNQIVAQRNAMEITRENKAAAMDAYRKIVSSNKQVVNDASIVSEKGVGRIVETTGAEIEKPATSKEVNKEAKAILQKQPAEAPATKPAIKNENGEAAEPSKTNTEKTEKIKEVLETKEKKEEKVPKAIMPKIEKT